MKKSLIHGTLYTVTSMDEYTNNKDLYNPKRTAIEKAGVVLPVKSRIDEGPGVYYENGSMVANVVKPDPEDKQYSAENIIDYSNSKDMKELIEKTNLVRNIENDILTTKDNILNLQIGNNDTPEMAALKKAINTKEVDIKQYEDRFEQFQNDFRGLKGSKITLGKLVSACQALDIEAQLILRDKEGCVNPMNTEVSVYLTQRGGNEP